MTAVPQENEVLEGHLPPVMTEGSASLTRAGARARICAVDSAPPEAAEEVPSLLSRVREKVMAGHAALVERPGTLIHAQPMTFHQAHARHRESADHFASWFMRNQRMGYGWLHLVAIKPALNYAEWATESELRFFIHLALAAAVFVALLAGGYVNL